MQKIFTNGHPHDDRDIMIEIKDDVAEFFYYVNYKRHNEWLAEQIESGDDEYLDEDAKANNGFYWIGKDDWNFRKNEWERHLKDKTWFTDEMFEYLDRNLTT